MKVVINDCFGGFGLSAAAEKYIGKELIAEIEYKNRHHPKLIECVEKLGTVKSSAKYAKLKIVEIPDGIEHEIMDYDGSEYIVEKGHYWE